ncbi:hypothetical protein vBEcoMphAPEC6_00485 [Escherichia phage ph0011]|nr:hypothetical protein vBEcoMphAPEC6_00485 [Escherichia phage ph0011]
MYSMCISNLEFSLDAAFKFAHKIETIYSFFSEVYEVCAKRYIDTIDISNKFDVWHKTIQSKKQCAAVFSVLSFNPSNCYPEKHERYPNDDMWFVYKEDADMSSFEVPDNFDISDLTEEWWFQQNLVHDDIDLFFYIVFKILYHNNIVKDSVSFSCLYIDELFEDIKNLKPVS